MSGSTVNVKKIGSMNFANKTIVKGGLLSSSQSINNQPTHMSSFWCPLAPDSNWQQQQH